MKQIIYEIYICKICKEEKPHLSLLEHHSQKYTWCNFCQEETLGKWIKAVEVKTK